MPTWNCCNTGNDGGYAPSPRCRIPLIEICDSVTQLRLDFGRCNPCAMGASVLRLTKADCPKYETVCETVEEKVGCGCNTRTELTVRERTVEIPQRAVEYPLHGITAEGVSVFVLDGKLRELGYGRYRAELWGREGFGKKELVPTGVVFNVEYTRRSVPLGGIATAHGLPETEVC